MSSADSPNNGKDYLPWIFFFLAIATRAPFTSRLLLHMDSCQFALALEKFDITVHQPHPPGYFLYIMLGRLLNVFIADANTIYVSITYIVEAFFSTVTALFCWRILTGQEKYLWISVVILGLAGGIRQNTPIFLLPVWLYSARNLPRGKIVASLFVLTATCLSWFIPMVWMSGGGGRPHGAV